MISSIGLAEVIAEALGLPSSTAIQHLRNLQKKKGRISFKGYGRGAAQMKPIDAARLLIAIAGSDFVKDSSTALEGYGSLLPIGHRAGKEICLEDRLADMMATFGSDASADHLSAGTTTVSPIGLTMMSALSQRPGAFPRFAILRRLTGSSSSAVSYASAGWEPVLSAADFAGRLVEAGLVRETHVTKRAIIRIAESLRVG